MARKDSLRGRMEGYFLAHPKESFNVEALMRVFTDSNEGTVRAHMVAMAKRQGISGAVIIKDTYQRGFWKLNPSYQTAEQMRAKLTDHINGNQRVFQGDRQFDPQEDQIQNMDHPNLPLKRVFFDSILERMGKSDHFSKADVDWLKGELPNLLKDR